jgi:hypothetical protein
MKPYRYCWSIAVRNPRINLSDADADLRTGGGKSGSTAKVENLMQLLRVTYVLIDNMTLIKVPHPMHTN